MGSLWQDLRYGLRTLVRRPGFAAVAVITIALGIGTTTAIFSVVNGVLLEPLPVHEPQQLVIPNVIAPTGYEISLSIPNFKDWRERSRSFQTFGANMSRNMTLTGTDRAAIVQTRAVLGDFFETLGVAPYMGRVIASDETWAGAAPLAVVTYRFWERRLGADPDALGRTISLDGVPYEIIGVMPPEFQFPSAETEVFLPMGFLSEDLCWDNRSCSQGTWAIARLSDGVGIEMAQADLDRVTRELSDEEGEQVAVARLQRLSDALVGDVRTPILILMGAVGFVLLIACANVASLLLSRGESRRRELALRAALGAGRGRVVRQLLTESVTLGLCGGVLGVGLAYLGLRVLIPASSSSIPAAAAERIGLDPTVLAFTFIVSVGAGLLFGVAPALRTSARQLVGALKEGGRSASVGRARQRLRSGLVVAEVALSLVLLIGAGLMIQSLRKLGNVDKGFVAENIFTARVSLPPGRYDSKQKTRRFFDDLLRRAQALPGVRTASLSQIVPLQGTSWEQSIVPEGTPREPENLQSVLYYMVTPDHFATFGMTLLRGRGFAEQDRDGVDPVCIIDETLAEKFWPGEDPIGKRVNFEEAAGSTRENPILLWRTVVGVVRNVRHYELENPARITVYVPMEQSEGMWTTAMYVAAKTAGDPLQLAEPVRRELAALDPDVPLYRIETMQGYVRQAMSNTRLVGGLLSTFSVLALLLSAVGIFGVISFSVVQRLREIGIRMALGARKGDVLRMVTAQSLRVSLTGVALGLAAALALTRLLSSVLYQVDPVDPFTYVALAVFLVAVSTLASYLPARRATRVDPAIVLREE
jgi:putative ABC transport system permease protein